MPQKDDRAFVRRFSSIILGLVILTGIIIALAVSFRAEPDPAANPSQQRFAEERIAPVAGVRAGASGQAELAAAAAQAAPAPAADSAAPVDGKQVYDSACNACHAAGVAGAPMPGSEEFAKRLAEKGMDGLLNSAINGLNVMPPRGGRPDLSDESLRAAIEFMQHK